MTKSAILEGALCRDHEDKVCVSVGEFGWEFAGGACGDAEMLLEVRKRGSHGGVSDENFEGDERAVGSVGDAGDGEVLFGELIGEAAG